MTVKVRNALRFGRWFDYNPSTPNAVPVWSRHLEGFNFIALRIPKDLERLRPAIDAALVDAGYDVAEPMQAPPKKKALEPCERCYHHHTHTACALVADGHGPINGKCVGFRAEKADLCPSVCASDDDRCILARGHDGMHQGKGPREHRWSDIAERKAPDDPCDARDGTYKCSLPKGHVGGHRALYGHDVLWTWTDSPEKAPVQTDDGWVRINADRYARADSIACPSCGVGAGVMCCLGSWTPGGEGRVHARRLMAASGLTAREPEPKGSYTPHAAVPIVAVCPLCHGEKTVVKPGFTDVSFVRDPCRVCNGTGIVWRSP